MRTADSSRSPTGRFSRKRRRPLTLSADGLIKADLLLTNSRLPLIVEPTLEGVNLITWASNNLEFIEKKTLDHGGILFRNFDIGGVPGLEQLATAVAGELLDYSYWSTPRSRVSGKVYTSTEYPANQSIPLHNEMSYARNWPMKIWFHCVQVAWQGGETPLADSRKVLRRVSSRTAERFKQKQVMYVRNYSKGLDLPWQTVFQTNDRLDVERQCRSFGIQFEWRGDDCLRTRQLCQAIATHPKTGDRVWFNQAHLFHCSNLGTELTECLLSIATEEELPRNACYGDGSPIEQSCLDEIREAYLQEEITIPWQQGDVLMLDNMLSSHGRKPFRGPRKVVVVMADSYSSLPK
jgi:alpha-ketoglutarate-dependent taurine dioxygenase